MAANDVEIVLKAKDAEVVQAWLRARQGIEQTGQELDKVGRKGAAAGKTISGELKNVASDISSAVAGMIGLGSAVQAVSTFVDVLQKELDNFRARRAEASQFQITRGIAYQQAAEALGPQGPGGLTPKQLEPLLDAIAARTGFSQQNVAAAATAGFGAGGSLSPLDTLAGVEAAATTFPSLVNDKDGYTQASAGVLTIQKKFRLPPTEAAAKLALINRSSRGVSAAHTAEHTIPAISELYEKGGRKDDLDYLASLVTGTGQVAEDVTGRKGRTQWVRTAQQLKELTATRLGPDASIKEMIEFVMSPQGESIRKRLLGAMGLDLRELEKLRKSGKAGDSAELLGEAHYKTAMMQFFTPGESSVRKEIAGAAAKLKGGARDVAGWNAQVAEMPAVRTERLSRPVTTAKEGRLGDTAMGVKEQVSQMYQEIELMNDVNMMDRGINAWFRDAQQTRMSEGEVLEQAIPFVQRQISARKPGRRQVARGTRMNPHGEFADYTPSAEDVKQRERLEGMLEKLIDALNQQKPQPVTIVEDKRPTPPVVEKPAAARLHGDRIIREFGD